MLVNLTDVLTSEGKTVKLQIDLEVQEITGVFETYRIVRKEPVKFTFSNIGAGKALVEGNISLVLMMNCDRCLQEVEQTFDISFSREVLAPNGETEEDSEDEQNFMEGYHLNIEDLISSEILIDWPMKVLCKEDCKGICRQCGKDLNTGECGCDTFVPDPRMAVIKDIFNANNKEV